MGAVDEDESYLDARHKELGNQRIAIGGNEQAVGLKVSPRSYQLIDIASVQVDVLLNLLNEMFETYRYQFIKNLPVAFRERGLGCLLAKVERQPIVTIAAGVEIASGRQVNEFGELAPDAWQCSVSQISEGGIELARYRIHIHSLQGVA
jgi:hypothetical protein